ncbi:MAG: ATP-binding protein [Spirochaetales bacterium]|nr:MAG: ATP-binding protein [Spirochaetales bacterium]
MVRILLTILVVIIESDVVLDAAFPSDTDFIDAALEKASVFLNKAKEPDDGRGLLVLRELLVNAGIHGNRRDSEKKVHYSIHCFPEGGFEISVEDEGAGFDYKSLDTRIPENPRLISKRGYVLINALSSKVRFNQAGNQIRVFITSPPKT